MLLFANNAGSLLASTVNPADISITLDPGGGALFPNPGVGESFYITVQNGASYEIMLCTARSGDVLSVTRAQDGTSASTWNAGSNVTQRINAGLLEALEQRSRALAEFAPINGPIVLTADPAAGTHAVRESYLAAREASIRSDLGTDITDRGALVGEVKEYYGLSLPNKYLWAAGQAVSRATYSEAFDALTRALVATVASGSPTITVTSGSLDGLVAGMPVSVSTSYFTLGATIVSVGAGTLTLSTNALASDSGVALRVCPYGIGDNSTTFNLPDRRGTAAIGRDDMNSSAASRVTTAGSSVNALRLGVVGGSQLLHAHSHGVNDPGHGHAVSDPAHIHGYLDRINAGSAEGAVNGINSGGSDAFRTTDPAFTGISVVANGTGISIQSNGSGGNQNVQPSTVCNAIIFVNV